MKKDFLGRETPTRGEVMDKEQHRVAKAQLVAGMQAGHSWQTAAVQAGLPISQINRVRAALGVSNHPASQEQGKKRK